MNATAIGKYEVTLVSEIASRLNRRPESHEVATFIKQSIQEGLSTHAPLRDLALKLRLAIKAQPAAPQVAASLLEYASMLRAWAADSMPQVIRTVETCNRLRLPVPLIFSCEKYLDTARTFRESLRELYFGVEPIIISGDPEALEETAADFVLRLPVDDSFEGLPVKVFEAFLFFHALDSQYGAIKLDDDLKIIPGSPLELKHVSKILRRGDYIGRGVSVEPSSVDLDRTWHFGKCQSDVPAIYGGAFKGGFAGGDLYRLSARALRAVYQQQMKYPGILAGELYEDKAIGDTMREDSINLRVKSLGPALNISVVGPERLIGS